ncbi:PIN/TRAM domain-containing protein [Halonatronum saccharophilum]|uniref:PIN/TRAM domain-containing protein n=1 Tax=Halonatronum saccharophilum TaxID=150060 RepID=UPI00047F7EA8|nr:PIN/TRAM domain-containing protein [Halonatronum saccharophilum]
MLNRVWKIIFLVIGAVLGYQIVDFFNLGEEVSWELSNLAINMSFYGIIIGGIIGFIIFPIVVENIVKFILRLEGDLEVIPIKDMIAGILGLVIALILGVLIVVAFSISSIPRFGLLLQVVINLTLAYLGWSLAIKKSGELFNNIIKVNKKNKRFKSTELNSENNLQATYKILDTSAIIDGRIADICQTSFIEGVLIIPKFVLEELQHIADSPDLLKRNRGRRGLDILKRIQKDLDICVEIYDQDFPEIDEVDSKLVKLALVLDGKVVTNDYNLNKVAELQGVSVLNINELANAVKPVVLPGEEMKVKIIKDGKEAGQGIGYLDDGTMIVVDHGRDYIGEQIEVLVTSILQTSAGRMIFAKPKMLAKQAL